jgi:hypothetical protein
VPPIVRGALPLHHIKLIHEQLKRLRNALFVVSPYPYPYPYP